MDLPIHTRRRCYGYYLSVRLETDLGHSCRTTEKDKFEVGELLSWSGSQLGPCQQFTVDNSTRIQLHTKRSNRYCVGGLVKISTGSADYNFKIPDDRRNKKDNHQTFQIFSIDIKSKYENRKWPPLNAILGPVHSGAVYAGWVI